LAYGTNTQMAYSIFNTRAAYTSCIKLRTSDFLLYVMSAGGAHKPWHISSLAGSLERILGTILGIIFGINLGW